MKTVAGLMLALGLLASPLVLQDAAFGQSMDKGGRMMQGGMVQGGMMGMGMAGGPGMILGLEESLDLSGDQVQRLEEMQESIRDEVQQHMSQAMEAGQAAMEALQSDSPDLGSYEESLRKAADHSILAHTAMARSDLQARQLLTAEQQKNLAYTRSMMMEMCRAANGSPGSGEGPG